MCSLGAAGHLDVVGLLGALGAPRLAGAPERLLRPEEEEDDRREDRQVDGGGEPVLFIRIRRVLVDDEPLVRALGHVGPEADVVQDGAAVDVGDVATCADATRPSRHRRDSAR